MNPSVLIAYSLDLLRPFLSLLLLFSGKGRLRMGIELSQVSRPFRAEFYDYTIHISSEGELELVYPIINYLLNLKDEKKILLIYTSPSVLKGVAKLEKSYPANLEVRMLPLLTRMPFFIPASRTQVERWPGCEHFIMVRYDFFFELLLYGGRRSQRKTLLATTLKGKENLRGLKKWYYQMILAQFDQYWCSRQQDQILLKSLLGDSIKTKVFEFRIAQVLQRQAKELIAKRPWYRKFKNKTQEMRRSQRLILGSAWPIDLSLLNNPDFIDEIKEGKWFVWIAPHKLCEQSQREMMATLRNFIGDSYIAELKNEQDFNDASFERPILVCWCPGILCDLYPYFGEAYIGGGFGRSVHSLLEAYWGSDKLYCGPNIRRSTEYDLIQEQDEKAIELVEELNDFYLQLKDRDDGRGNIEQRKNKMDYYHSELALQLRLITKEVECD